ncbi:hypothetical protein [Haliangium ochraceum]|uniref:hypothetical protein n=1 Tax=Haliangium ochraceum TaxID=80816 RepID=UPI00019B95B9|nr:hypothetical protein [Haliangium ochraceum]
MKSKRNNRDDAAVRNVQQRTPGKRSRASKLGRRRRRKEIPGGYGLDIGTTVGRTTAGRFGQSAGRSGRVGSLGLDLEGGEQRVGSLGLGLEGNERRPGSLGLDLEGGEQRVGALGLGLEGRRPGVGSLDLELEGEEEEGVGDLDLLLE